MIPIIKSLLNFVWSSCKWGLLIALVGAAGAVLLFYNRVDEEIRRRVEARIAAQYPDLTVSVRSARLVTDQGIELRGLSIAEPGASGPGAELAYLEEVFLAGQNDWRQMLQGNLSISNIVIRRPTIRMTRRADGTWSAAKLLPLPRLSADAPRGSIENGVVEIHDPFKNQPGAFVLRDAQLQFEAAPSAATASSGRPDFEVRGRLSADHVRKIDVQATMEPSGRRWSISGMVEDLDILPELARALPADLSRRLTACGPLRAQAKGTYRLRYDEAADPALDFDVSGQLARGRIDDPRLPSPLTDLRATFRIKPKTLTVNDLTARSGRTTLKIESFKRDGHAPKSPYTLKAECYDLMIDRALMKLFPVSWQEEWQKSELNGKVDVERLELAFDGERWVPRLLLKCVDVAFSYHAFPYRLEHGKGRIEFKESLLTADLTAYSDSEPVRIVGSARDPGPNARVSWEIRGDSLHLDEKLFKALDFRAINPGVGQFVRALHPNGTFSVLFRTGHGEERLPRLHKHLSLGLNRCSLQYEGFPYKLDNVRGTLVMNDDAWEFKDLEGTNDTGRVTCHGRLLPVRGGSELVLNFEGRNVPLEEELRDALAVRSPGAARLWRDLKPRGTVNLKSVLTIAPGQSNADLRVTAWPVFDEAANQLVSIEPSYFPYRLEKLQGEFTYQDGGVKLHRVRAEHRGTKLEAAGECRIEPLGGWRLRFDRLHIDRLRPTDRDLLQALGGQLKKRVADLSPRGSLNFRGTLELASDGQPGEGVSAGWHLDVEFQPGRLDCGVALEDVYGGVTLEGSFDGRRLLCRGELDFDSLTLKEFQFTEVRGPFSIDDGLVLLGAAADRQRPDRRAQPGRPITARLYGGRVQVGGKIAPADRQEYFMQVSLIDADLARFTQEAVPGHQKLTGLVSADLDLDGRGRGMHNLAGRGRIRLRNADLFE
ncbi:MAG TPA: AsmA-like C-terminal region-containing protein, partial [Pirellulales bacterium]|nr:AsmA-like C-terminal region-containing protein [Pirellulales bacterium]